MSVIYSNPAKSARMTAVRDLLNGGTLEIGTAGMATVLSVHPLDAVSGSVSASGVLTLSGFPKVDAADADGTAAEARVRSSTSANVITGLTVGLAGSGADIILDSVDVHTGQNVTIAANPTFTHG